MASQFDGSAGGSDSQASSSGGSIDANDMSSESGDSDQSSQQNSGSESSNSSQSRQSSSQNDKDSGPPLSPSQRDCFTQPSIFAADEQSSLLSLNVATETTEMDKTAQLVHDVVRYRKIVASAQDFRKRAITSKLSGKFQDIKQYTRYYFHKSLDLLKQAQKLIQRIIKRTMEQPDHKEIEIDQLKEEEAKLCMLTGNTILHVSTVIFESETRGKFVSRALRNYKKATEVVRYLPQVQAMQNDLIEFIKERITGRVETLDVQQQILEQLSNHIPAEMPALREFVGKELFELYFKLADEIASTTADRKGQLDMLENCLEQSEKLLEWKKAEEEQQQGVNPEEGQPNKQIEADTKEQTMVVDAGQALQMVRADPSVKAAHLQKTEEVPVLLNVSKTYREYKVDREIVLMKIREIDKHIRQKEKKRQIKMAQDCERKGDYFWRQGELVRALKFFEQMLKLAYEHQKIDTMVNSSFKHGMFLAQTNLNAERPCQKAMQRAKDSLLDFMVLQQGIKLRGVDCKKRLRQAQEILAQLDSQIIKKSSLGAEIESQKIVKNRQKIEELLADLQTDSPAMLREQLHELLSLFGVQQIVQISVSKRATKPLLQAMVALNPFKLPSQDDSKRVELTDMAYSHLQKVLTKCNHVICLSTAIESQL